MLQYAVVSLNIEYISVTLETSHLLVHFAWLGWSQGSQVGPNVQSRVQIRAFVVSGWMLMYEASGGVRALHVERGLEKDTRIPV